MTITKSGISEKKPDAQKLETDPAYRKILELKFSEMIPFVLSNIRRPGFIPLFYLIINFLFLIFLLAYAIWAVRNGQLNMGRMILHVFSGIVAGSILVIAPHELLHGLAYRALGAKKIRFGADLQQFIFYVSADRFPISKRELVFLALAPFVIINLLTIALTAFWAPVFTMFSCSFLLSHNIMCIGDFAMISYVYSHKGEVYNFDDIVKKRSYFFKLDSKP